MPGILLVAAALALGGLTSLACVLFCAAEFGYRLTAARFDGGGLMLPIGVGIALALLGPGAYSLDAHIFGRRVIVFSRDGPH